MILVGISIVMGILGVLLLVHFLFINIPGLYYILFELGLQKDQASYIIGSVWGFAALLFGLHLINRLMEQGKNQLLLVISILMGILGVFFLVYFLWTPLESIEDVLVNLGLQEYEEGRTKNDKAGYIIGSLWGFAALLFGLHLRNKLIEQGNEQIDNFKEQLEQGNKQLNAFKEQLKQGHDQLEQDREHNLEDRYIRSVELMGNTELGIRLGGLAGLEALLNTNEGMYVRIRKYLGDILREPLELKGWVTTQKDGKGALFCRKEQKGDLGEWRETDKVMGTRPDIVSIVKILQK